MATVGKAMGHVVKQLLNHCAGSAGEIPCEVMRTKAETMQTMMAESRALKRIGAKRAGIRMSFSYVSLLNQITVMTTVVTGIHLHDAYMTWAAQPAA